MTDQASGVSPRLAHAAAWISFVALLGGGCGPAPDDRDPAGRAPGFADASRGGAAEEDVSARPPAADEDAAPPIDVGPPAAPRDADARDADAPKLPLVIDGTNDDGDRYASVVIVQTGRSNCSGTLIPGNRVVTAAHCVCAPHTEDLPPGAASRRDAAHCVSSASVRFVRYAPPQDVTRAGAVRVHPDYFMNHNADGAILGSHADVAVIALGAPAPAGFAPARLATAVPAPGDAVTVAGFGFASCMGMFGQRRWGNNRLDAVDGEFLRISNLDGSAGAITHSGDSGGALFARDASGDTLAGVTSFGRCMTTAGYTSVLAFADFFELGCPPCAPPAPTCATPSTRREFSGGACDVAARTCRFETRDTPCPFGCNAGVCEACRPSCDGRRCGPDGCGGSCGACASDETCAAGACQYVCPTDTGCAAVGRSCASATEVLTCTANPRGAGCFSSVRERCRAGEVCTPGLGCSCAPGYVSCRGACAPRVSETCNGVDDDCDGLVDEDRVCVARYDLPSLFTVFPLNHTRGDREFNGHGPIVEVTVTAARTPTTVTVRACVTMTETVSDYTTGSRCVDVVTLNVRNTAVLTPGFRVVYTDTDHGFDDAVARASSLTRSDMVRGVTCVGDGGGNDICGDRSYESADCSGCQLRLGSIEVVRAP